MYLNQLIEFILEIFYFVNNIGLGNLEVSSLREEEKRELLDASHVFLSELQKLEGENYFFSYF